MSSFRQKLTVLRANGGHYDNDGMWQDGSSEELTVYASVQPLNADERSQYSTLAPEGAAEYRAVKLYSNVPLKPAKQSEDGAELSDADIVLWRGRKWRIVLCEDWQSNVINHYHMVAWEVQTYAADDTQVSP